MTPVPRANILKIHSTCHNLPGVLQSIGMCLQCWYLHAKLLDRRVFKSMKSGNCLHPVMLQHHRVQCLKDLERTAV